ncbi:MAG: lysine N(6)-hydroxylase/L-ornithine N(5)-oxygenase family protein [Chloracidobacterium sp.]|nr:lysine N(6)-hydroxylase/L-ornithine N(5)-oxygenase family protein [Chloracidobacterium sp.]MDW8218300.1 FAD/NAD(P)-binding protein [Acidobacteriota bacterium]
MLDWLIVGGGIHGVHAALVLTQRADTPADRLCILDPQPSLLGRWTQCTKNVGMAFLRSPLVHHLGLGAFDLLTFARTPEGRPLAAFAAPYDRPGYALFQAHCRRLVADAELERRHLRQRAVGLSPIAERGWRVETPEGSLEARRVLLALGLSEQPAWPDWAQQLKVAGGSVWHVFDGDFHTAALPAWRKAVVFGGGITAAQLALALSTRQPGTVTLLMPHPARIHQFDSDPGWLGPKYMRAFEAEPSLVARRRMIREARHRGSIPPDVHRDLRRAVRHGEITLLEARVAKAVVAGGNVVLDLDNGDNLKTDCLLLATGFDARRPGGAWLDAAIAQWGLPTAPCGYPVVSKALRWARGLYVMGPLAELELGPTARNIAGARKAADRLAQVVERRHAKHQVGVV